MNQVRYEAEHAARYHFPFVRWRDLFLYGYYFVRAWRRQSKDLYSYPVILGKENSDE